MTEARAKEELMTLHFPKVIRLEAHTVVQLSEYSTTLPTGVYPGKMWRAESKAGDPFPGVEVPGLNGKWIIGAYLPLDERQCHLRWLPLEVAPYNGLHRDITEHCHNEECLYLSLFGPNIDDVHHSPNCRGALLRRAFKAEKDRDAQAAMCQQLRYEIERINGWSFRFPETSYCNDQKKDLESVKHLSKLSPSAAEIALRERCWTEAIEETAKYYLGICGTKKIHDDIITNLLAKEGK